MALGVLADIGVGLKYGHGEVGHIESFETDGIVWEQHEIELALSPLPVAADSVALVRWILSNLARRAGMRCSFDPIVRRGHAGNGLHFHFSPVVSGRHAGGKRPDGSLGEPGSWLVAGLVTHAGALMAFGNRTANSFVRLTQGKETPGAVTWGDFDRSALVRLPILATAKDGRVTSPPTIELRLPDGSAHPHLLLAGAAQAMMRGRAIPDRDSLLSRTAASHGATADSTGARIPSSFREVAEALAEARAVLEDGEVFPSTLIDRMTLSLRT
jgi:glutamine synthetase